MLGKQSKSKEVKYMTYEEAINGIIDMGGGIEKVSEHINAIKEEINRAGQSSDTENWKEKYMQLDGEYRKRFFANDMNTVVREDNAAAHRINDEAREEVRKQEAVTRSLADMLE